METEPTLSAESMEQLEDALLSVQYVADIWDHQAEVETAEGEFLPLVRKALPGIRSDLEEARDSVRAACSGSVGGSANDCGRIGDELEDALLMMIGVLHTPDSVIRASSKLHSVAIRVRAAREAFDRLVEAWRAQNA